MKTNMIAELWEEYRKCSFPKDMSEAMLKNCHAIFFAGAGSFDMALMENAGGKGPQASIETYRALHAELTAYATKVLEGKP